MRQVHTSFFYNNAASWTQNHWRMRDIVSLEQWLVWNDKPVSLEQRRVGPRRSAPRIRGSIPDQLFSWCVARLRRRAWTKPAQAAERSSTAHWCIRRCSACRPPVFEWRPTGEESCVFSSLFPCTTKARVAHSFYVITACSGEISCATTTV
jgi:hypothetical protein